MSQSIGRNIRLVMAWLAGAYLCQVFVRAGWAKFDPGSFWTAAFAHWGYPVWLRLLVGLLEVVGGVMLLLPWVATYGALVLAAVMCAAIGTLLLHGGRTSFELTDTAYLFVLAWVAFEWRSRRMGLGVSPEVPADTGLGRARS